jgi:hypothetical protein
VEEPGSGTGMLQVEATNDGPDKSLTFSGENNDDSKTPSIFFSRSTSVGSATSIPTMAKLFFPEAFPGAPTGLIYFSRPN